jgi:predicted nucleic acid-binding protein
MIIVSDSTPLIALSVIDQLVLLKTYFNEIYIPPEVYREVVIVGENRPGANTVGSADWIKVREVKNITAVESMSINLGKGESEAIILSREIDDLLIIDDGQARRTAELMGLKITGTIGILLMAAAHDKIDFKYNLDRLISCGFRLSEKEYNRILNLNKDL